MTNNQRHPSVLRRDLTAPKSDRNLHEHYVRAINAALESGNDEQAHELASAYSDDLGRKDSRSHLRAA